MNRKELKYFKFMGVKVDNVNFNEIKKIVNKNINNKAYICITDVVNVIKANKDERFLRAINGSLISVADGTPLSWFGKISGYRKIERIFGGELLKRLLEENNGYKHFLLGDTEKTISKIIAKARLYKDELEISGYSPPFKKEFDESDNKNMINIINQKNPDLIWVSFGGGKQDKWMHQNINKLNRGIMIGVGAAFRYYIGEIKTPPIIVQTLGLQWYTRTLQKPIILKNQLRSFPIFLFNFVFEVVRERRERISKIKKSEGGINAD